MKSVDPIQLANIKRIQEASQNGRLVLFVGAGVSKNSGVPMWGELIERMKEELPQSVWREKDDLKLAQLYKDSRGEKEYLEMVMNALCHNKVIPNSIHQALLDLNPAHIITTNYDDLIEQEIRNEYKQFAVVSCDKDLPNMAYPNSLIKMHGDFDHGNIVLAEDDYYNYSKNFALIRAYVQSLFASKLVVFIGFSFTDLNLKMILNDVKHILEDSMQRVYLISLEKPDDVTLKYYENKGINIVYLSDNEVLYLTSKFKDTKSLPDDLKSLGMKLYRYLRLIKNIDYDHVDDLITYVFNKVNKYSDEIRCYGSGLRYLFPDHTNPSQFNEHSAGLQTYIKDFDNINDDLKTFTGKKAFVKKHGKMIREYIKFAYYNYIGRIDNLLILGDGFWAKQKRYIPETINDSLRDFNFSGFENHLKRLSSRTPNGTLDDMEYPYAFYRIGDYYRAYQEFNKILDIAWKRGKYVLYFLCLYNMWSLRYAIKWQFTWYYDEPVGWKPVYEKLCAINLNETLAKLQLPKYIRRIFEDLLANRYIGAKVIETEHLSSQLHEQRKLAERGGYSINSHAGSLISKYQREKEFSRFNYVLSDYNGYNKAIGRSTISGIINSFATTDSQEREFGRNSRIVSFETQLLEILLFGIETEELVKLFKQYEVNEIEVDNEGVEYIKRCLSNLSDGKFLRYLRQNSYDIQNGITSLIFLISKTNGLSLDVDKLYEVIKILWQSIHIRRVIKDSLGPVVRGYNPTPEVALDFVKDILRNDDWDNYDSFFKGLCDVIVSSEYRLSNIEDYIKGSMYDNYLLSVYLILADSEKDKFIEYAITQFKSSLEYIHFIYHSDTIPSSIDEFDRLSNLGYYKHNTNDALFCNLLVGIRKKEQYRELWPSIDNRAESDECLRFFLNPMEYDKPDSVLVEWLRACDEEIVKDLIKNEHYSNLLKDFIANANLSPKARMIYLSPF